MYREVNFRATNNLFLFLCCQLSHFLVKGGISDLKRCHGGNRNIENNEEKGSDEKAHKDAYTDRVSDQATNRFHAGPGIPGVKN